MALVLLLKSGAVFQHALPPSPNNALPKYMRLEFEPNVTAIPLVENEMFDDGPTPESRDFQVLLKKGISAAQNGDRDAAR